MAKMTAKNRRQCKRFAHARPSASGGHLLGDDFDAALSLGPRFLPRLDRRFVVNADDPKTGFATKAEATAAASRYRESCREYLKNH